MFSERAVDIDSEETSTIQHSVTDRKNPQMLGKERFGEDWFDSSHLATKWLLIEHTESCVKNDKLIPYCSSRTTKLERFTGSEDLSLRSEPCANAVQCLTGCLGVGNSGFYRSSS